MTMIEWTLAVAFAAAILAAVLYNLVSPEPKHREEGWWPGRTTWHWLRGDRETSGGERRG